MSRSPVEMLQIHLIKSFCNIYGDFLSKNLDEFVCIHHSLNRQLMIKHRRNWNYPAQHIIFSFLFRSDQEVAYRVSFKLPAKLDSFRVEMRAIARWFIEGCSYKVRILVCLYGVAFIVTFHPQMIKKQVAKNRLIPFGWHHDEATLLIEIIDIPEMYMIMISMILLVHIYIGEHIKVID